MAASIDYVGNRGKRQHRGDRHQRGPDQSGDRPRHPPRRERVRSERRAGAARGARRDVRPVQPEPDDGARLGARHHLQLARGRAREAAVEPLVGPRQLHAVALLRRRPRSSSTAIRGSTTAAAIATTSTRSRPAPTSISARALAAASSSARIRAIRSTRRSAPTSTATAPTTIGRCKGVNDLAPLPSGLPSTIVSAVDSTGRRGAQRHRRREAGPARRAVPIHRQGRQVPGGAVPGDLQPAESRPTSGTRPARGIR